MSRYFLAVAPPEPLHSRLEAFRSHWGSPHHPVEPHVTVKVPFAWEHDPEPFLAATRTACRGTPVFQARLGGTDRFPAAGVLYLTVVSEGLISLHRSVVAALDGIIPLDAHGHEADGYTPHLTLAVSRFGIDDAGLDAMESEALGELAGLPPFAVTALRCYRREASEERWQPFCDIPLA